MGILPSHMDESMIDDAEAAAPPAGRLPRSAHARAPAPARRAGREDATSVAAARHRRRLLPARVDPRARPHERGRAAHRDRLRGRPGILHAAVGRAPGGRGPGARHPCRPGRTGTRPTRDEPWTIWWMHLVGRQVPDLLAATGATPDQPVFGLGDPARVVSLVDTIIRRHGARRDDGEPPGVRRRRVARDGAAGGRPSAPSAGSSRTRSRRRSSTCARTSPPASRSPTSPAWPG